MTDMTPREIELRELREHQAALLRNIDAHIGATVRRKRDLLRDLERYVSSEGPFLPETRTALASRLWHLQHDLSRSMDAHAMESRTLDDIRIELRAEYDKRKQAEEG